MHNLKKNRLIATVLSLSWLIFLIFHIILTGKIPLCNIFGNLPTFIFLIIPLIFIVYEVLQRERRITGILIAIFSLFLGTTQSDVNIFRIKEQKRSEQYTGIKVFDWNTSYWDQNKNRKKFFDFLKNQRADIYILQEYYHYLIEPDTEKLLGNTEHLEQFSIFFTVSRFFPHYVAIDDTRRMAKEFPGYYIQTDLQFVFISRYPIKTSHADYSEQFAVYDVDINGRLIRFFNVHMLLHIEPGNPFVPYFYQELNRRFQARQLGFKNLKEDIKKTKFDYLVVGDFNSTKAMGVMNELLKNHIDAVKYSNELIPLSLEYKGLRLWRFDYALVSKTNRNPKIRSYKSINNGGLSDHNPLCLVLDINYKNN